MKKLIPLAALLSASCANVAEVDEAPVASTAPALVQAEGPTPASAKAAQSVLVGKPVEAPLTSTPGLVKPETALLEEEEPDLLRQADFAEAMRDVEDRQRVFADASDAVTLEGSFTQGGVIFGRTLPGSSVRLDGEPVMIDGDGRFVVGFGRDSALTSLLTVALPTGDVVRRSIEIEDRDFPVDRIDGLDQSKVSGFTKAQLEKIAVDREKKNAARTTTQEAADWAEGFSWPLTGRISGVFGSQRILNGEPKRPHSGVDVAQPTGAPIRAPAAGIVRLAETDMYFEGGLVLLDHGHWLESAFLHMSRIDVEPGQRVEKGDILGAVGATGRVTGPHLHWSVKWAGRLVDPQLLVGEMPPPQENAPN